MVSPLLRSSLREIRQSLGRYLAIFAIVALGVGFFAGLRMAEPNMKAAGRHYVEHYRLHDFRLLSTLGFSREDVDYFGTLEGVDASQGAVYTEFLWQDGDEEVVLLAQSLTQGVNMPNLLHGRMPAAANECLGDARYFDRGDIGTAITVAAHNDDDTRQLLRYDTYTIVGVGDSPLYLNAERGTASIGTGNLAAFVLIPIGGFDFEAYHEVYLHLSDAGEPYSAAYDAYIDRRLDGMEDKAENRGDLRYHELRRDALEKISDAEEDLKEGWEEYYDGVAELADGKRDYAEGLQEYEDGYQEYRDGRKEWNEGWDTYWTQSAKAEEQLEAAEKQLTDGEKAYADGLAQWQAGLAAQGMDEAALLAAKEQLETQKTQLDALAAQLAALENSTEAEDTALYQQLKPQYEAGMERYTAAWAALEPALAAKAQLDETKTQLETARATFETQKATVEKQLADGLEELLDGQEQLSDARKKLDDAKRELDEAAADIAQAEQDLADGYQELLDGEQELQDGYEDLADLKAPDIFVLTRDESASYVGFDSDTNIIKAIAVVFPAFFYLVAALVCMTTMKRMVDEQRTQLGVLKALGYSNAQVLGKYVLYAGSAAVAGTLVGYALGSTLLPWVIWELYGMQYGFTDLIYTFEPGLALLSFAAAMASSVGVTILACRAELRHQSAELLRPKAPKAGKRVFLEYIAPLWRALSFLQKVSIRNVLRYKSRLVMILLGIGGCTALLITGFGIQDSVADIGNIQYEEITLYDYEVSFREETTPAQAADYLTARGWAAEDGLLLHTSNAEVIAPSGVKEATLTVSSTGSVEGFVALQDENGAIAYPGDAQAVLTRGLAENLGLTVGDTVELRDDDLHSTTLTVAALCDNYLGYAVYITPASYETMTGAPPIYKTLYLNAPAGADVYAEGVKLTDKDAVAAVRLSDAGRTSMTAMLSRMDYVVVVVVVFAAALAFVVLYNLTNINISERIREIATIKVLGFTRRETASYIFREIYMLSALGSLVGVGLGKALHSYVMAQVKVDGVYFPSRISPQSYLISVALTMVFTVLICLFLRRKLNTVDMAESLKSIE